MFHAPTTEFPSRYLDAVVYYQSGTGVVVTFAFMTESYPVLDALDKLRQVLFTQRLALLQAPPGAGKSTILPLQLLHEGWLAGRKIVLLEPRRLAAKSVAGRMAQLLGEEPGETVGYRIRFETLTSKHTRIEVVTEGLLTRMIQHDNALEDVGLVIFDEFHERSLHADLALSLCGQIKNLLRDDLRILIMSATLDAEKIATALGRPPVITSLGKQFEVDLRYVSRTDADEPMVNAVTRQIRNALRDQSGDVLVFLPGAGEIKRVAALLEGDESISIHPLYGDLPFRKQQDAILPHPAGMRKVVLATSIAETSLTIQNITTVIDCGYSRVPRFDPRSGFTRLETVRVTRDVADQRAGRAGRLRPGVCYRLWTEGTQRNLLPSRQSEILEADLSSWLLELASWGVTDVHDLIWIDTPPAGHVEQAKALLRELDALDSSHRITAKGKAMVKLPAHPRIAHMLLSAASPVDQSIAADLAALLDERDPLSREHGVDVRLRLEELRRWRATGKSAINWERIERAASAWRRMLHLNSDSTPIDGYTVGRLLMEAYPDRIARQMEKHSMRYKLVNGRVARLLENDPLVREEWLAIAQLDSGASEGKIFLAAPLNEQDLIEKSNEKDVVEWSAERGMIHAVAEKRIGSIVMGSRPLTKISEAERIPVLCAAVRQEGLKLLNWGEAQEAWQARVLSLRHWVGSDWPDVTSENLIETCEQWLAPFLSEVSKRSDFQRLNLPSILTSVLSWEQSRLLDRLAPARLEVPSGSMIMLNYFNDGRAPVMEVRLQEIFGLLETPTVNEGKTRILLHLLSPGFKPVQVTQDLRSFWQNTYHEVRKELRMRYPKHSWPEDPWTAKAIRGAVKRKN